MWELPSLVVMKTGTYSGLPHASGTCSALPSFDRMTPERADAIRNRTAVLDAASQLVDRNGAAALRMADVARHAGVGPGTVYRAFGGRSELLLALLDDEERGLQEALLRGDPPLGPGAPATQRLLAFVDALHQLTVRQRDVLMAADAGSLPGRPTHRRSPGLAPSPIAPALRTPSNSRRRHPGRAAAGSLGSARARPPARRPRQAAQRGPRRTTAPRRRGDATLKPRRRPMPNGDPRRVLEHPAPPASGSGTGTRSHAFTAGSKFRHDEAVSKSGTTHRALAPFAGPPTLPCPRRLREAARAPFLRVRPGVGRPRLRCATC